MEERAHSGDTSEPDEGDYLLTTLKRPWTSQAALGARRRRRRRLALWLLRADWAHRVEAIPTWATLAAGAVGVTAVWQFGMLARDVRMVTSQWVPVVGLVVGAAVLVAVAAVAAGKAFDRRDRKSRAFAAAASVVALASCAWTAVAAAEVRPLQGPDDGSIARVSEPFDVVSEGRDAKVYSITVIGIVEAPLDDNVVDGMYQGRSVQRCWTLVGTVELVQAPGWPWERETVASGSEISALGRGQQDLGLTANLFGSDEPQVIYQSRGACQEDVMWTDLTSWTFGTGPVPFAITFPVDAEGIPTDIVWIDGRGRKTQVSLLGGGIGACPRTSATSGEQELHEALCTSVVNLEERAPLGL